MSRRLIVLQVDARIWLAEAARRERRPVTLDTIPASAWSALGDGPFQALWLRAVWDPGGAAREAARRRASVLEEARDLLPDLALEDLDAAPLPVRSHVVRSDLGGDDALEGLRAECLARGLQLFLDFAPAAVAADHPWVAEHPEFLLPAGEGAPGGCPVNTRHPALREALIRELEGIAARADGVVVTGAELASPRAVLAAHGRLSEPPGGVEPADHPFWPEALSRARARHPYFTAVALASPEDPDEANAFDRIADAKLVDLLIAGDATGIAAHLAARSPREEKTAAALELPGGRRAREVFGAERHAAAALAAYFPAGAAIIAEGEIAGRRRREHPHLGRRPHEEPDREVRAFHERLIEVLARPEVAGGGRSLLACRPAWEENPTWKQFLAFTSVGASGARLLCAVNHGPLQAQCYADLSGLGCEGRAWRLQDLFSFQVYERDGDQLAGAGLYLDLAAWDYNVFEMTPA